jgi:hypothetical protein
MEIISKSGNFDEIDMFRMLNGKCDKLKTHIGAVMDCIGYVLVKTDDEKEILYIAADNGLIVATNSPTVKRTFSAMLLTFGAPSVEKPIIGIVVTSSMSSHGREFLDLDIVR